MKEIIAVINQKGGVGKNTTALAVGAGLALKGDRGLYVDLNPQGNLSFVMEADSNRQNALVGLQQPETIQSELQQTAHQLQIKLYDTRISSSSCC